MKKLTLTYVFLLILVLNSIAQEIGSFTDSRDGHSYKTVTIGNQIWMAENLAYLPRIDRLLTGVGLNQPPAYYVYKNDQDGTPEGKIDKESLSEDIEIVKKSHTYKTYGALYNFQAAKCSCPTGWHLPEDKEWQELERTLGMDQQELNFFEKDRTSESLGNQLKSSKGWDEEGNTNIDKFGFSVLPAGERDISYFSGMGSYAVFWGNSVNGAMQCAVYRKIESGSDGIYRGCDKFWAGKSVRCIKNK